MIHYSIVAGSHRNGSETRRVAETVQEILKRDQPKNQAEIIDLGGNPVPMMQMNGEDPEYEKIWLPIAKKLQTSQAFVFLAPEWGGMVPAGLKNFLLLSSNAELGHKPAMIVSVSAGTGGAYPIAELRMSGYKNNHVCFIPEHVVVRHIGKNLKNLKEPASDEDRIIIRRLEYGLSILEQYAVALNQVRESGVVNHKEFPFGM